MDDHLAIPPTQPRCPVCDRDYSGVTSAAIGGTADQQGMISRSTCPYCGEFRILFRFEGGYPIIEQSSRYALSMACRRKNLSGSTPDGRPQTIYIDSDETAAGLALNYRAPSDAIEQLDTLLETFAEFAPNLTQETPDWSLGAWTALVGLPDHNAFRRACALAVESGYLEASDTDRETWALTLSGWNRVRQIREVTRPKEDAFVAMWFHSRMDSLWQDGFHPALYELGWKPIRIDREHFLGRIDDEIMKRIRRSGLLIADITGARPGVYFEAGFALGLGIPVIWTCNEGWRTQLQVEIFPDDLTQPRIEERSWFDSAHFDTKTFPHLLWKDAEDLKSKLSARLEALGLVRGMNRNA